MAGAPIEITLYEKGPDPGEGKTYVKKIISLGLLMRAVHLSEELDAAKVAIDETLDQSWLARFRRWRHRNDPVLSSEGQAIGKLAEFIAEVFDDQFSKQELLDGADVADVMTTLQAIVVRAKAMPKFPTNPPTTSRRKRR